MAQREDQTLEWQQYMDGIDYNSRIDLYETVNENERFYSGDQWAGVVSNGLPTPVFNLFKRVINYFIAAILSQNVAIQFSSESVGDEPQNPDEKEIKQASELATDYSETLFEKMKMTQKFRQWLLDAALSADAAGYCYWDPSIDTGQRAKGDICVETVDNVNVFFGNPNDGHVQSQPYIIIAFRELVANLQKEAENNGVSEDKIRLITADNDTFYQSGDRAQIELEDKGEVNGKCMALLKLWKQDGKVYAKKSTRYTTIRNKWDTKLSLYPVTWMNWDQRKNSYHGQALGTGLVPNQIFINKMFAMAMMSQMHYAFPKAIYDKSVISAWNNAIGTAIGVDGGGTLNVSQMATYLQPGNMSNQVFQIIDTAIRYTKDMLGATDAALGETKPDNTSAIIAVQQASAVPLESIKQNLYQFVEDMGYIWLDFMANYYGKRKVDVVEMGQRVVKEFDFSKLKKMKFRIKIDVGPSSYWSQITAIQTLDNLLKGGQINFQQYLDRLPSGIIPQKTELIEDLRQQDIKQQFIWEQMARFLETLPPEQQEKIKALPPEIQEQQLMQMMMQQPQQTAQLDPQSIQAAQMEEDRHKLDIQQRGHKQAMEIAEHQRKLNAEEHRQAMDQAKLMIEMAKLGEKAGGPNGFGPE